MLFAPQLAGLEADAMTLVKVEVRLVALRVLSFGADVVFTSNPHDEGMEAAIAAAKRSFRDFLTAFLEPKAGQEANERLPD